MSTSVPAVGPLPHDLSTYEATDDGRHLRLGMHPMGIIKVVMRIGFARETDVKMQHSEYWYRLLYTTGLSRDPNTATWADAAYGPLQVAACGSEDTEHGGYYNMTGYDLVDSLRSWLKAESYEGHSMCEVVLIDDRFKDLRKYVGKATVFWSHLQVEGFFGHSPLVGFRTEGVRSYNSTCYYLWLHFHGAPPEDSYVWMDYFCLRQCQSDFKVQRIIQIIGDINNTVACFDTNFEYTTRSFCVLELYATSLAGGSLKACQNVGLHDYMEALLSPNPTEGQLKFLQRNGYRHVGPVNAAEASTRRQQDKEQIDKWVTELDGGFEKLNASVTKALYDSCPNKFSLEDRRKYGLEPGAAGLAPRATSGCCVTQ